jgi:hypothetical protein
VELGLTSHSCFSGETAMLGRPHFFRRLVGEGLFRQGLCKRSATKRQNPFERVHRLQAENLEQRQMLAGDVVASLTGDELRVIGDQFANSVQLRSVEREVADTRIANDGVTSVSLDLKTLEDAAGLRLASTAGTVPPADTFQVGFDITEASTFQFATENGFELIGGSIEHTGTVTFEIIGPEASSVTLGDFSIGFDASRISDLASGFFVADTASGGFLPVFDLSAPGVVDFADPDLTIGDVDLLLSPELAELLAGEGSGLAGADVGDAQVDALTVAFQQRQVEDGKTSVFLDVPLLSAAAGLEVIALNGTASPAEGLFQVAFDIADSSDFQFSFGNTFAPIDGTIQHTGSVVLSAPFAERLELGNFSIGFDAARAVGDASGFFVADTLTVNLPIFDIGLPGLVAFDDPDLVIDEAQLLVSKELAGVLEKPELIQAAVGLARIDAITDSFSEEFFQVIGRNRFGRTTVNGAASAEFSASSIRDIRIDLGGGSDVANVRDLALTGDLTIDLGSGFWNYAVVNLSNIGGELSIDGGSRFDGITVNRSSLGSLSIDSGAGTDVVTLNRTHIAGDAHIDLGRGWFDSLSVIRSEVEGNAEFDGGRGFFDRVDVFFSSFGSLSVDGFERRRLF